jgi:hypothetical protein
LRCYPLRSGGSWDDVCDLADAAWVYYEIIMLSRRCRYVLHARSLSLVVVGKSSTARSTFHNLRFSSSHREVYFFPISTQFHR